MTKLYFRNSFILLLSLLLLISMLSGHVFAKAGECLEGNCDNGTGTFEYQTGMKYVGQWLEGKEHGKGKMTLEMGTTYEGDYKNGLPHGTGTYTIPDGRQYVGEWQAGKPEGKGIETHPIGTSYEGEWHDGLPNGYGTTREHGKIVKQGNWQAGEFVGKEKAEDPK